MAENCKTDEYWDDLIKRCRHCQNECKRQYLVTKCTSYCVSYNCRAQPGHYYDRLLKRCVRCVEICGRHPAECSQHCQTTPRPPTTPTTIPVTAPVTLPVTTKKLLICVTSQVQISRVSTGLDDSAILLYPLLALCTVLVFSSLFLALVVFLRGTRAQTPKPRPKETNHNQECAVQLGEEVGQPSCPLGQSSKKIMDVIPSIQKRKRTIQIVTSAKSASICDDSVPNPSCSTDREPSDDSSPTETCVCVHCFPDLKALGQGNDRPLRTPSPVYPQAVLHRAPIQNGGPRWTEENLYTSGSKVPAGSLAVSRDNCSGQT